MTVIRYLSTASTPSTHRIDILWHTSKRFFGDPSDEPQECSFQERMMSQKRVQRYTLSYILPRQSKTYLPEHPARASYAPRRATSPILPLHHSSHLAQRSLQSPWDSHSSVLHYLAISTTSKKSSAEMLFALRKSEDLYTSFYHKLLLHLPAAQTHPTIDLSSDCLLSASDLIFASTFFTSPTGSLLNTSSGSSPLQSVSPSGTPPNAPSLFFRLG